jgi:hypothetical protein
MFGCLVEMAQIKLFISLRSSFFLFSHFLTNIVRVWRAFKGFQDSGVSILVYNTSLNFVRLECYLSWSLINCCGSRSRPELKINVGFHI